MAYFYSTIRLRQSTKRHLPCFCEGSTIKVSNECANVKQDEVRGSPLDRLVVNAWLFLSQ